MFISTVLCLPVIFNCCVLVVSRTRLPFNSRICVSMNSWLDPLVIWIDLVVENLHSTIQEDTHRTSQTSREGQERVTSIKAISNRFLLSIKLQSQEPRLIERTKTRLRLLIVEFWTDRDRWRQRWSFFFLIERVNRSFDAHVQFSSALTLRLAVFSNSSREHKYRISDEKQTS